MKKLFVAVALVMGLGTSVAFADNFMVDSVTITMINDFTPIEVKDLGCRAGSYHKELCRIYYQRSCRRSKRRWN